MIPIAAMLRIWYLCVLATMATALGQPGRPDAAFDKIPFEEWLKGGGQARIQWHFGIRPPRLSEWQRLEIYIQVDVAEHEFVKRPERGQMVAFLEIRDHENRIFRTHWALRPAKGPTPASAGLVKFTQFASIVPGDYEVAVALYDTISKEHSMKRMTLRVPELAHDPLPNAWRDMPTVDFSSQIVNNPPRLYLPLKTEKAVRIEVVVNQSFYPTAMGRLNPLLRVISQMEMRNGSMRVTVLDLERQKVMFSREVEGNVNWVRIMNTMQRTNPYMIDAQALGHYKEQAQFFVSVIRKRLERSESDERERVLIVLSAPRRLPKGEDLGPIQATLQPEDRVFYIRSYPVPIFPGELLPPFPVQPHLHDVHEGPSPAPIPDARLRREHIDGSSDSLERTLEPLNPHVFNVVTPEQFRGALAKIMSEILQQK
jgi:hypothetical protein